MSKHGGGFMAARRLQSAWQHFSTWVLQKLPKGSARKSEIRSRNQPGLGLLCGYFSQGTPPHLLTSSLPLRRKQPSKRMQNGCHHAAATDDIGLFLFAVRW
ncbi:uncharacterized protein LOC135114674 [Scylla paramamosain]|uniref:uncharacterized protein LOC135114674 n=1 Tax=Scylla paramamosain TaxID=85552 RepID=UPI003082C715